MTVETRAHVVSYGALGNGGLGQISMAGGTGYTRLVMRCVAEFHMSLGRKTIDALPGNLHLFTSVFNHFLYFRASPSQLVMAQHTFTNRWNSGSSTSIGAHMTIETTEPQLYVRSVWKRDRLARRRSNAEQSDEPQALPSKCDG